MPQPVNVVVQNQVTAPLVPLGATGMMRTGNRSRMTAIILAFFLGAIGGHKFYLGRTGAGLMYLMFAWTFIPSLLAVVDLIQLAMSNDQDFELKYNMSLVGPVG